MGIRDEAVSVGEVPASWLDEVLLCISTSDRSAVVVLPQYVEDGIAVFPSELTPLVKVLQAEGIDSSFMAGDRGRTFQSTYSAAGAIFIALLLNVGSNVAWDGFKLLLRTIRARIARTEHDVGSDTTIFRFGVTKRPDGSQIHWREISGPSGLVLDRAEAILEKFTAEARGLPIENDHVESSPPQPPTDAP